MQTIYPFIFFLGLPLLLSAQDYSGDIHLSTQAEVDSFALHYPPMSRLLGGLQIGEFSGSDIHDLSALPHFSTMGELLIVGTQLTSLESFAGVDSTYRCRVMHNPLLQNLRGLHHLKNNGEYLVIYKNAVLTSLDGLDSLQHSNDIIIASNDELRSLEGAPQLAEVGELNINQNKSLKTLSGLPVLWKAFSLTVDTNDSLEHFGGFPQLTSLYGMRVVSNPRLKDFAGFNNGLLEKVGRAEIQNNAALESLSGLEHLDQVATVLYLTGNHRLRQVLHLDNLSYVHLTHISGDLIDTIHFPAMQRGYFEIYGCPSLVHLRNVFPVADSIRWKVYDNPALLTIHEDAGPKKMSLFVASGPLLQSVTGFDSTLLCAHRPSWTPIIEGVTIASPNLVKVVGFRNVRVGNLAIDKSYTTQSMERVEGFDRMETALGGLTFASYDSTGNYNTAVGIKVLRGFQNLRRVIDGPLNISAWVRDTLIGFQMLDSIQGRESYAGVGWVDTCYVDPAAFSQLSYTEASFSAGGQFPWPLPSLQKIYRNVLYLGGNAQPDRFEGSFPLLKTVGAVFAWNTDITSLRGLEGITRFDRVAVGTPFAHLENNPNLSDCSAVCSWVEHATFNPNFPTDMVITNNPLFPCTDKATLLSWCDTVTAVQAPLPPAAEGAKAGELLVYPNPVQQGMLHFRLPEAVLGTSFQVSVYDLQGRVKVIRTDRFTADYALPVGDWPSGTYLLQVQTRERVWAATVQVGQAP